MLNRKNVLSCLVAAAVVLSSVAIVLAGKKLGRTVFFDDVSVGSWTSITNHSAQIVNGGTFTTGTFTYQYRLSGTNFKGRLPLTSVIAANWTGSATSNAVKLTWDRYDGIATLIILRSIDNGASFQWATLNPPSKTTFTDTGVGVTFFTTDFEALFTQIPDPIVTLPKSPTPIWTNASSDARFVTNPDTVTMVSTTKTTISSSTLDLIDSRFQITSISGGGGQIRFIPFVDDAHDLFIGDGVNRWSDIELRVSSTIKLDTGGGTIFFDGNLIPEADNVFDIGSDAARIRELFVGPDSVDINGLKLRSDGTNLFIVGIDNPSSSNKVESAVSITNIAEAVTIPATNQLSSDLTELIEASTNQNFFDLSAEIVLATNAATSNLLDQIVLATNAASGESDDKYVLKSAGVATNLALSGSTEVVFASNGMDVVNHTALTTAISNHVADASAHHARYTDAEAVTAISLFAGTGSSGSVTTATADTNKFLNAGGDFATPAGGGGGTGDVVAANFNTFTISNSFEDIVILATNPTGDYVIDVDGLASGKGRIGRGAYYFQVISEEMGAGDGAITMGDFYGEGHGQYVSIEGERGKFDLSVDNEFRTRAKTNFFDGDIYAIMGATRKLSIDLEAGGPSVLTSNSGIWQVQGVATGGNQVVGFDTIDTNIVAKISTHTANAPAHHAKYTDAEAISAVSTVQLDLDLIPKVNGTNVLISGGAGDGSGLTGIIVTQPLTNNATISFLSNVNFQAGATGLNIPTNLVEMQLVGSATGNNNPPSMFSQSLRMWDFNSGSDRTVGVAFQLPGSADLTKAMEFEFVWAEDSAGSGSGVVWKVQEKYIEIETENLSKAFDKTTSITQFVDNVADRTHSLITSLDTSSMAEDDLVFIAYGRVGSDDGDDFNQIVGGVTTVLFRYFSK